MAINETIQSDHLNENQEPKRRYIKLNGLKAFMRREGVEILGKGSAEVLADYLEKFIIEKVQQAAKIIQERKKTRLTRNILLEVLE